MKSIFIIFMMLLSPLSLAAEEKVVIDVEAMTCPLCVTVVNQVLRKTDGVIRAKSSMKTRQAYAIVPQGFDTAKLLNAIDETGYKGTINHVETVDVN